MVPTVSMLEATIGIPFQAAPLLRNLYARCRTTVARLGASDRLGRISTSSKSSLGSLSIRMVGDLQWRQDRGKRGSEVHSICDLLHRDEIARRRQESRNLRSAGASRGPPA